MQPIIMHAIKTTPLVAHSHTMTAIPYLTALTTYFNYDLLFAFGQFRDFFRKIFCWKLFWLKYKRGVNWIS